MGCDGFHPRVPLDPTKFASGPLLPTLRCDVVDSACGERQMHIVRTRRLSGLGDGGGGEVRGRGRGWWRNWPRSSTESSTCARTGQHTLTSSGSCGFCVDTSSISDGCSSKDAWQSRTGQSRPFCQGRSGVVSCCVSCSRKRCQRRRR